MRKFLFQGIALMLVGSLVLSCGKDEKDDIFEDTPEKITEDKSDDKSEDKSGNNNLNDSTTVDSLTDSAASTAVPEEIVPVKITASTFPDPVFRKLISGRDYDKNGDGTLDKDEIIYIRNI